MRTKGKLTLDKYYSTYTESGHQLLVTDDNTEHLVACWNAIESIGGDPEMVGEMKTLIFDLFANLSPTTPLDVVDRAQKIMINTSNVKSKEAILDRLDNN